MVEFHICGRSQLSKTMKKVGATHVLSLTDMDKRPFLRPGFDPANWLWLKFEDVIFEQELYAPTKLHVALILEWGLKLPEDAVVVVHCEAGVSRSTAAVLAMMVDRSPDDIAGCVAKLLELRSQACPNPLITRFADELIGCDGKLHEAAEKVANEKLFKFLR